MAVRLAEKAELQELTENTKIFVSEKINIDGVETDEVFRTTFSTFVDMLKNLGIATTDDIGDIETALTELHTYAEAFDGGDG